MDETIDWAELVRRREEEREKKRLSGMRIPSTFEPKPWGEGKTDEYKWDRGIVLDTLFDGLEDEIERVNKKMALELGAMADDPCSDLQKALSAAQGALALAIENAQRLPKIIDFDVLSIGDAAIYSAVEEAQDWVDKAEEALRKCKEAM